MRRKATWLSVLAACLGGVAVTAQSQQAMMSPPPTLYITREVVKPGKTAAHEKWETGWPRAFGKANWSTHYIAASSLTGEPRALYMTGYDSMEEWAKDGQAQEKNATLSAETASLSDKDGEYLTELRNGVFTYMPELSYHPEVPVARIRYFGIVTFHVKRGHDDHFVAARKIALAAHEKANLGDHFAVYHMIAGGPAGTYLVFLPMKSLAELDQFPAIHGKAYKDAMGEDGQKKMDEFDSQGLESSETNVFALSPQMSYPSKEWVEADAFWATKPSGAAKPMAKKEEAKN